MAPRIQRIAFLAYNKLTLLDLIGPHDALRRVAHMGIDKDVRCSIIGVGPVDNHSVTAEGGLTLHVDATYAPLDGYDLLVVPGGVIARQLVNDARLIDYLHAWGHERPIASVCTGSLLLGAAGHLRGLAATTHHSAFDLLRPHVRFVRDDRVVDEGRVITSGGVCAGIDLGVHLVGRFWGAEARDKIAHQMNYLGPEAPARHS